MLKTTNEKLIDKRRTKSLNDVNQKTKKHTKTSSTHEDSHLKIILQNRLRTITYKLD